MFSTLSRGSSRVKQTYIYSSCRCNILAHANPQQTHLPVNGGTRAAAASSSFSTSATQLQNNNGEPKPSEPATGDDSKPASGKTPGKSDRPKKRVLDPLMPLSRSMPTLRALRQSLLSEPVPPLRRKPSARLKPPPKSKSARPSAKEDNAQPSAESSISTPEIAPHQEAIIEEKSKDASVAPAKKRPGRNARQKYRLNSVAQKQKLVSSQVEDSQAPDAAPEGSSDKKPGMPSNTRTTKASSIKKSPSPKSLSRSVLSRINADTETSTETGHNRSWTVIAEDGRKFIVQLDDSRKAKDSLKSARGREKVIAKGPSSYSLKANMRPSNAPTSDSPAKSQARIQAKETAEFLAENPTIFLRGRLKGLLDGDQLSESERLNSLRQLVLLGLQARTTPRPKSITSSRPLVRKFVSSFPGDAKDSARGVNEEGSGSLKTRPGTTAHEIKSVDADSLKLVPLDTGPLQVPKLSYGLERVLFNPGVYQLQDPRSRVFNFDPYLQTIMPVSEFDFNALKQYVTSSRDKNLIAKAIAEKKKYTGSTSSTTSALAHFHFLLSQWREITFSNLSKMFPVEFKKFTALQRGPVAIFLRWRDGAYAIDADKQYDTANILMSLGKSMEKLLTLSTEDFEKYRKTNSDQITEEERNASEEFHYTGMGDFLLRSQLDAHDSRLPGTGMFDLKTRAVISVRMDTESYEEGRGYEIRGQHGEWESFEREYYDMIRSAFLKYSLQVRMGRMDGIFVAYHNTERIFGFQYISLPEMDFALHGTTDTTLGDQEFKLSLDLLNRVLDRATAKYPKQSMRLLIETRPAETPFTYIFAEPFTEDAIEKIQKTNKAKIEKFEKAVLGVVNKEYSDEDQQKEWDKIRAEVEESVGEDEAGREAIAGDDDLDSDLANGNEDGDLETEDTTDSDELPEDERELADMISTTRMMDDQEGIVNEDAEEDADETDLEESTTNESQDAESTGAEESLLEADENQPAGPDEGVEADLENSDEVSEIEQSPESSEASQADENGSEDTLNINRVQSGPPGPPKPRDMMAMTLTIRNKVNGRYVTRPNDLREEDKWKVEYSLSEIQDPNRVARLYDMAKSRRDQAMNKQVDLSKDTFNGYFLQKIKDITRKGREWRRQRNEEDKTRPTKVLDVNDGKKMAKKDYELWTQEKSKGDGQSKN
ncbi:mitochondrial protein Pet127-domain-containing protein [Rhexocercosporidium sp. MPI-PUGE-AT-0058]|nr:mitochondrial protein Pet127-domain-containing protein [Rhexocercosporidium sp. MPI-PUGE-AT-0058]